MQFPFFLLGLYLTCYSSATEGHGTDGRTDVSTKVLKSPDGSMAAHTPLIFNIVTKSKGGECDTLETKLHQLEADLQDTKKKLHDTVTGLEGATKDLQDTKTELQETKTSLQANIAKCKSGSTFIRWGRTNCTANSQLVYSGAAGGSDHSHSGGAANTLCLTLSPQWDGTAKPGAWAQLHGTEYESIPGNHDHDVPCSVCHAPQSTTIMVPATLTCPPGWTSQYTGHLITGHPSHPAASEYLCLDGHPENMPGGYAHRSGHLVYYTLIQCGILQCPPYIHDRVVTCVVCSK